MAAGPELTFWDHLDALRAVLLRMLVVLAVLAVGAFAAMPWLFDNVILAPTRPDFPLYRLMDSLGVLAGTGEGSAGFKVEMINTELSAQLFVQMSTAGYLALVLGFPVVVYLLWTFVAPGLYEREKRGARMAFMWSNIMFYLGVGVGYFVVFPVTLRFLADYQLSASIPNIITINSYIDTFLLLTLIMGVVFQLPLLAWMLGRAGVLTRGFFNRYRRHAIVGLLVLAALITPSGDPFSLFVVFVPIYLLWEGSAALVPASPAS